MLMVVFGLYLVLSDQFGSALILYGIVWVTIAAYWARYAILHRKLT